MQPNDNSVKICFYINEANINLGASIFGSGIGDIKNIHVIQNYDPEIADALMQASGIPEIKSKVEEISQYIAQYYQTKQEGMLDKIKNISGTIKSIIETGQCMSPIAISLYNVLAAKFGLPQLNI